jgi:hypothetical protein
LIKEDSLIDNALTEGPSIKKFLLYELSLHF